jgi:hypothetical protein
MPSPSNNSMPSLSSYRESEFSGSTHVSQRWSSLADPLVVLGVDYGHISPSKAGDEKGSAHVGEKWASCADLDVDYGRISPSKAMDRKDSARRFSEKWASFGDLDVDYGRISPSSTMDRNVEHAALPKGFLSNLIADQKKVFNQPHQIGDMPQTAERRSKKTKKAPKPTLKKKTLKKKTEPIEEIKEINDPEALLDYYKAPELVLPEIPVSGNKKDKYGVTSMKTPVTSFRNRMPKLGFFGKGRRNSPTSVTDGRQESQFYPDMDDDEGEEFGGLLSC